MRKNLGLLLGLSGLLIAACSGGGGSTYGDDASAQQQKDAQALATLFNGVQGTWTGLVANAGSGIADFEADLKLYVDYVQDGTLPDGRAKLRPVLKGRFQPKDFTTETDLITLIGDYDRTGRLQLTAMSSASPSVGASGGFIVTPNSLSVTGSVGGEKMTSSIGRQGGIWGVFTAKRISSSPAAPTSGERTEYRDRFIRINTPWIGRYSGVLRSVDGNDYGVEIILSIFDRPIEGGGSSPVIGAQYRRTDVPAGAWESALIVDFNSQTGQVLMRNDTTASGPGSGVLGGLTLSLAGTLKLVNSVRVLDVSVSNRTGKIGTIRAFYAGGGGRELP